jgi:hypothetical protein
MLLPSFGSFASATAIPTRNHRSAASHPPSVRGDGQRGSSWPADARRRSLGGEHLAPQRPAAHVLGAPPLVDGQEQGSPIRTAEHAGEAAAIEVDDLQDLAARAHAHAATAPDVAVPHGTLGIQADAVGVVGDLGPGPAVGQATVGGDAEGGEPLASQLLSTLALGNAQ